MQNVHTHLLLHYTNVWLHRIVELHFYMCRCRYAPEAENEASRRWRDGSLEEDLPMRTLSEMFNVNYFLVSQTNPHIVPALNMKRRFNRKLGNLLETEWKHR